MLRNGPNYRRACKTDLSATFVIDLSSSSLGNNCPLALTVVALKVLQPFSRSIISPQPCFLESSGYMMPCNHNQQRINIELIKDRMNKVVKITSMRRWSKNEAGDDYFGNLGNFARSRAGRGDISGQTVTGRSWAVWSILMCWSSLVVCLCEAYVCATSSLMPPNRPPTRLGAYWAPRLLFDTPQLPQSTLLTSFVC